MLLCGESKGRERNRKGWEMMEETREGSEGREEPGEMGRRWGSFAPFV